MKKILSILAVLLVCFVLLANGSQETVENNVIKVGATPEPHAEMLKLVVDNMAEAGCELKIIEFTDYVTPNQALEDGDIDANFFQHVPYMESFN
ncbi:MAG: MetQ/NlpA family ABC transporter substrate-binding protein, partial [Bacilli bacterium]|nr:MetQ/NlpA family ABC transporter substrate-binding protein [Bacilli bacterium]